MDRVKDKYDVTMNYSYPGYHVTEIELNNRIVKERYHTQYHRFTFQNILKVMVRYLDFEVIRESKYFLVKGGFSP